MNNKFNLKRLVAMMLATVMLSSYSMPALALDQSITQEQQTTEEENQTTEEEQSTGEENQTTEEEQSTGGENQTTEEEQSTEEENQTTEVDQSTEEENQTAEEEQTTGEEKQTEEQQTVSTELIEDLEDPANQEFSSLEEKIAAYNTYYKDKGFSFEEYRGKLSLKNYTGKEKEVIVPDGVEYIDRYSFWIKRPNDWQPEIKNETQITSLTISSSVEDIHHYAFNGLTDLSNVIVNSENKNFYTDDNGNAYKKAEKSEDPDFLFLVPAKPENKNYKIPSGKINTAQTIFLNAETIDFSECTEELKIYYDVGYDPYETSPIAPMCKTVIGSPFITDILEYFIGSNFPELETIKDFPNVTRLEKESGFSCGFCGCKNLKNIENFGKITYIGKSAFSGCKSLPLSTINELLSNAEIIGERAFSEIYSISNNSDYSNLPKTFTIPSNITEIGKAAFASWDNAPFTTLDIQARVKNFDSGWFECHRNSSKLEKIILPETLTEVVQNDSGCFSNLFENLKEIHYPKSKEEFEKITNYEAIKTGTKAVMFYNGVSDQSEIAVEFNPSWINNQYLTSFGEPGDSLDTRMISIKKDVGTISQDQFDELEGKLKYMYGKFAGWYTELEGGEKVDCNYKITEPITLYAHWERDPQNIYKPEEDPLGNSITNEVKFRDSVINSFDGTGTHSDPYRFLVYTPKGYAFPPNTAPSRFWGFMNNDKINRVVKFENRENNTVDGKLVYSFVFDKANKSSVPGAWNFGNYKFRFNPDVKYRKIDNGAEFGLAWKGNYDTFWKDYEFTIDASKISGGQINPLDKVTVMYYGAFNSSHDTQTGSGTGGGAGTGSTSIDYGVNLDAKDSKISYKAVVEVDQDGYITLSGNNFLAKGGNYKIVKEDVDNQTPQGGGGSSSGSSSHSHSHSHNSTQATQTGTALNNTVPSLTQNQAEAVTEQAIANTVKSQDTTNLSVVIENVEEVNPQIGNAISQKATSAKFENAVIKADTVVDGKTTARMYIDAAKAGKLANPIKTIINSDKNFADNAKTLAVFEKFFINKMAVATFSQKGDFGMDVDVAVKLDIKDLNAKNLKFFSYNLATNTYTKIQNPNYWIDGNGYLHFETKVGDTLIVTDSEFISK